MTRAACAREGRRDAAAGDERGRHGWRRASIEGQRRRCRADDCNGCARSGGCNLALCGRTRSARARGRHRGCPHDPGHALTMWRHTGACIWCSTCRRSRGHRRRRRFGLRAACGRRCVAGLGGRRRAVRGPRRALTVGALRAGLSRPSGRGSRRCAARDAGAERPHARRAGDGHQRRRRSASTQRRVEHG